MLGVSLTWGALWSAIGAGIGLVTGVVSGGAWANPISVWAVGMGLYGLVSGAGFATLLSLREGRKTIQDLSLRRAAVWGVLGAAAVPLLFLGAFEAGTTVAEIVGAMIVTGVLGGTFAPASIAVAKRAELQAAERTLLSSESSSESGEY